MNNRNKLAWGLISLIIGILFLLKYLHMFSGTWENWIFDYRNLFILIGGVFAFVGKNKTLGIILMVVGIGLYLDDIILWTKNLSNILWPIILILTGVLLLVSGGITKLFK